MSNKSSTTKTSTNINDSSENLDVNDSEALLKQLIAEYTVVNDVEFDLLKDRVQESVKNIESIVNDCDAINKSFKIKDSYGNELTSIGTEDKVKSFSTYGFSNDTLNYMLWTALYNDSWVFKKAIDKPAQDMISVGVKLISEDKNIDKVYKELRLLRQPLIELVSWGRLYGGSVAIMMFNNLKNEDYYKPLNPSVISKSKVISLYVTDRWFGCSQSSETVSDMTSLDFGKPKYYNIVMANGKEITVHHTYILRFEGRTAPKLIKTGQLQGWGYAEGSHILNELSRDDQLKASITSLVNKALIEVIKMSGMRGVFMGADKDNENQLRKRLEMVNWARNFNSLTFLDKDDEYEQKEFSGTSGLANLLETNMKIVAAAVDMPSILFGDLSDNFSKDSDAYTRYDDIIYNLNESYFNTCMTKLLNVLYIKHGINESVEFEFNSLIPDVKLNNKVDALDKMVTLLSKLLADGVINLKLYAQALNTYTKNKAIDLHWKTIMLIR